MGRKQYLALGCVKEDCKSCGGVGYINDIKDDGDANGATSPLEVISKNGEKVTITHRRKRRTQAEIQRARVTG